MILGSFFNSRKKKKKKEKKFFVTVMLIQEPSLEKKRIGFRLIAKFVYNLRILLSNHE